MGLHTSYPSDLSGVSIESGTQVQVVEFTLATGSWTQVQIPDAMQCKSIFMRSRSGDDFKLSHADGGPYVTIPGSGRELRLAKLGNNTVGYVQGTVSGTLEVMLIY